MSTQSASDSSSSTSNSRRGSKAQDTEISYRDTHRLQKHDVVQIVSVLSGFDIQHSARVLCMYPPLDMNPQNKTPTVCIAGLIGFSVCLDEPKCTCGTIGERVLCARRSEMHG